MGILKAVFMLITGGDPDQVYHYWVHLWEKYVHLLPQPWAPTDTYTPSSLQLNLGIIAACASCLRPLVGRILRLNSTSDNSYTHHHQHSPFGAETIGSKNSNGRRRRKPPTRSSTAAISHRDDHELSTFNDEPTTIGEDDDDDSSNNNHNSNDKKNEKFYNNSTPRLPDLELGLKEIDIPLPKSPCPNHRVITSIESVRPPPRSYPSNHSRSRDGGGGSSSSRSTGPLPAFPWMEQDQRHEDGSDAPSDTNSEEVILQTQETLPGITMTRDITVRYSNQYPGA